MSNQLEFEICINRVRVYNELISESLKKTEQYLADSEISINFTPAAAKRFGDLIGKTVYFKCFIGGYHCNVYYYDGQVKQESWNVPVELIKFKEY